MERQIALQILGHSQVDYIVLDNDDITKDMQLVIENSRGIFLAAIKIIKDEIDPSKNSQQITFKHVASEKEIEKAKNNIEIAKTFKPRIKELILELNLDMKILSVELTLDTSKIIINFASENRVDFRELVKRLAQDFRKKIELRQVGSRDEVKIMGGVGICGRVCCCHKDFSDYEHVSMKMAKNQNLSLNPNNISGICGKLYCCLAYENDFYNEMQKMMPDISQIVTTPDGKGEVMYNNLLKGIVQVKISDSFRDYNLSDLKFQKRNHKGCDKTDS